MVALELNVNMCTSTMNHRRLHDFEHACHSQACPVWAKHLLKFPQFISHAISEAFRKVAIETFKTLMSTRRQVIINHCCTQTTQTPMWQND